MQNLHGRVKEALNDSCTVPQNTFCQVIEKCTADLSAGKAASCCTGLANVSVGKVDVVCWAKRIHMVSQPHSRRSIMVPEACTCKCRVSYLLLREL